MVDTELQKLEGRMRDSIPRKPISSESERQPEQDDNYSEQTLARMNGGLPDRTDAIGSDFKRNIKQPDVQGSGSVEDGGDAEQFEYITGIKLALATGIISLATFTMLLDTAIIVTVSRPNIHHPAMLII